MKLSQRVLALALSVVFTFGSVPHARACGPSFIEPIFVFKESPDLPFEEFAKGKIGIVQSSFGRKTLVIAYRYLNGGAFTNDEQQALVEALRGKAPEDEGKDAVKAWVSARKEIVKDDEKLPEIYAERQYGGYDFFPNCAKNAFEVATETLKDRAATYGAEDNNVRAWLAAQDIVFQNCSRGARLPEGLGTEGPGWLRKDRDYQIAAALFYSLSFDDARARFENIAADNESPWQRTADYLVARALVRQASLTESEKRRRAIYEQAEVQVQMLLGRNDNFYQASQKLLALIKYRLHPEERVVELGHMLAHQDGNENLRQDLTDYVWLLDKLSAQVLKEEEKRRKALKSPVEQETESTFSSKEAKETYEAVERGDLIEISIALKKSDGTPDYSNYVGFDFKHDTSEDEILQAFELKLGRKLTADETKEIRERHASALSHRQWLVSPNRKWEANQHESNYSTDKLAVRSVPAFLRDDDLSDWIFTVQTEDPQAYGHAFSKWRESDSPAWLVAALVKADRASAHLAGLIRAAERVGGDAPDFPTVAYHLIHLKMASGKRPEARKLLDEIISGQLGSLPISARNQFLEQRMRLAQSASEFLQFSPRRAAAFYNDGMIGRLSDLLRIEKTLWSAEYSDQSKEEYERQTEESYKDLLPWDDRLDFDEKTVDILNWHFPLQALAEAARDPALPDYLQLRLVLAVWTRAVLLKNNEIAKEMAAHVVSAAPEMSPVFAPYLKASSGEQEHAALYVLLKSPGLSPFIAGGIPVSHTPEELNYYFESAWWCTPSDTEYHKGEEVPKIVPRPIFLSPDQLNAAQGERRALIAIGDGKRYLGKRVIEWAQASPDDVRVPEALFIAAKANQSYKYGCGMWESDPETEQAAERILKTHYPRSLWTAKLDKPEN